MNTRFWGLSEECGRASHDAHISESRYGAPASVSGWRTNNPPFEISLQRRGHPTITASEVRLELQAAAYLEGFAGDPGGIGGGHEGYGVGDVFGFAETA
jgi:hypothetical protein